MTIKHLVISGGGPLGFRYLGALEKLEMIDRPWSDVIKVNAKQILTSYYNKGLFDKKLTETIFKPLLEAKDLKLNITLKEFYEYTKIDLHIFTFEINKFKTVELSHISHPDLSLLQALTMSSSLPGIFIPIIIDNYCYLDGGVMCNYPVNECLRDHENKDEILGVRLVYNNETGVYGNVIVNNDSSLLEYTMGIFINSINYIRDSVKLETLDNTIDCVITENPLTISIIQDVLKSQEMRKNLLKMGEDDAVIFLSRSVV